MKQVQHGGFSTLIGGDWSHRLATVVDMMRGISRVSDPQEMVQQYMKRMREIVPANASISLSRRDLVYPHFRITRSTHWEKLVNPWKSKEQLPLLKGGLLGELIYGDQPAVLDDYELADDDPAKEFLEGNHSLAAIPLYDQGFSLNMVVLLRKERAAFDREFLPEHIWLSNLFGRMTQNLVLTDELRRAYESVDRELQVVGDIQRSLLPVAIPKIPTLDLAVHYQTSRRAGGDYYDFFELPDGRWGILIADVSGHGTPAAVLMAIMHSIAHTLHDQPEPPSRLLNFVNRHLASRYTADTGTFVTAFYGIYDPNSRTLTYANAGHNPPRHRRAGQNRIVSLEGARNLPLGIDDDEQFSDVVHPLLPGDSIVFYTDGITEARNLSREMFGVDRLDTAICQPSEDADASSLLRRLLQSLEDFAAGAAPADDRTLLTMRVISSSQGTE